MGMVELYLGRLSGEEQNAIFYYSLLSVCRAQPSSDILLAMCTLILGECRESRKLCEKTWSKKLICVLKFCHITIDTLQFIPTIKIPA